MDKPENPSPESLAALETAAKALLDACYYADAQGDLSHDIDGSLLDTLSDALDWRFPIIWTQEQVDALNAFQDGYGHAFTCGSGNRSDEMHRAVAKENNTDDGQLIATRRGWVCPVCSYRQFWAHEHMFKGAMPNPLANLLAARTDGGE